MVKKQASPLSLVIHLSNHFCTGPSNSKQYIPDSQNPCCYLMEDRLKEKGNTPRLIQIETAGPFPALPSKTTTKTTTSNRPRAGNCWHRIHQFPLCAEPRRTFLLSFFSRLWKVLWVCLGC